MLDKWCRILTNNRILWYHPSITVISPPFMLLYNSIAHSVYVSNISELDLFWMINVFAYWSSFQAYWKRAYTQAQCTMIKWGFKKSKQYQSSTFYYPCEALCNSSYQGVKSRYFLNSSYMYENASLFKAKTKPQL